MQHPIGSLNGFFPECLLVSEKSPKDTYVFRTLDRFYQMEKSNQNLRERDLT